MNKKIFIIPAILLASCTSTITPSITDDKVISRSDSRSSRPSWLKEGTPLTSDNTYLYFLGQAKLPATKANISMGYRIAENNAKNTIAGAINQNLNYIFQNAEEGMTVDANQIQFVSTESAKAVMNMALPSEHYWEKVLSTVDAEGNKEMFYSIFARVKMKESDLKKAIDRTLNGNNGISVDFKKKVDQQWDNMVKEQYPEEEKTSKDIME